MHADHASEKLANHPDRTEDRDPVQDDLTHVVHHMSVLAPVSKGDVILFVEGNGLRLRDTQGREFLDGLSGMTNVNLGYGRAELGEVASQSMRKLAYAKLFFGQGSVSAARLAAKLAEITPAGIDRFFFTLGGSDANDSVIKIVRYFNTVRGCAEKNKIIARRESYHGMTLGATSLSGQPVLWRNFGALVPGIVHVDQPHPGNEDPLAQLERTILDEGPETVAAFLAEPISLPARFTMPPADYWPGVRELCTKYDLLMVSDEVVTGFGRTGKMFALEHWSVEPDMIIMAKGLTSGYLPLGAVGMRKEIYDGIAVPGEMFMHGFTAAGHPVCCDVALRNLQIIETEAVVENAAEVGAYFRSELEALAHRHANLGSVRGLGMLQSIDVIADPPVEPGSPGEPDVTERIDAALGEQRLLTRVYGQTIGLAPSLVATREDIDDIIGRLEGAAESLTVELQAATAESAD